MAMGTYTIEDLSKMNLNDEITAEFEAIDNPIETAMTYIRQKIDSLRHPNGRKIRAERRENMIQVMGILYEMMYYGYHGECNPSMRTIAHELRPDLDYPTCFDSEEDSKRKEKALAPTLMSVHRSIHMLAQYGFIRIHLYRAESNQDPIFNPNFFYELTPVSLLCEAFALLFNKAVKAMSKLSTMIAKVRESVLSMEKIHCLINNLKPSSWPFPEPPIERQLRLMGVLNSG